MLRCFYYFDLELKIITKIKLKERHCHCAVICKHNVIMSKKMDNYNSYEIPFLRG